MLGWLYRLMTALLRPPVLRPLSDAERALIREAHREKRAATMPVAAPPLAGLPWHEWVRRSAERQAGAQR